MGIAVTAEPIDEGRCKFILTRSARGVGASAASVPGVHRFTSLEQAAGNPLAESVLSVPGISEVVLSGNVVTVVKSSTLPWCDLEERIRYAIAAAVEEPEVAPDPVGGAGGAGLDDDSMYDIVAEMFESQINPAVAQHGGMVELIDVEEGTVIVRMMGGCQGCGMANVTLRQGIESTLRRVIPSLKGIQDITDHSAGTNPYFSAEKK